MGRFQHNTDWGMWGICAVLSLAWMWAATQWPHALDPLDDLAYDWLMREARPAPVIDPDLALVLIDDTTFTALDERPLSRQTHARLLTALAAVQARQVTWDVIFRTARPADETFREAMTRLPTILACEGALGRSSPAAAAAQLPPHAWLLPEPGGKQLPALPYDLGLVPVPDLAGQAAAIGHISATVDADGILRRIPLIVQVGNHYLPSIALATVLQHLNLKDSHLSYDPKHHLLTVRGARELAIPLDDQGCLLVDFVRDPAMLDQRSYGQLLRSLTFNPEAMQDGLQGKSLLIGPGYSGAGDFVATPQAGSYLGVLVIFSAINTILTGNYIVPSPRSIVVLLALTLIITMGILARLRRTAAASMGMLAVLGLGAVSIMLSFRYGQVYIPPAMPLGAGFTAAVLLVGFGRYRAHQQAARLATMLARFVSPTLLRELDAHGVDDLKPMVQRVEVTVLFVDIVSFTAYTESHAPEQVSAFLGDYYRRAMDILFARQGTLDKLMGDGILAYWGAPDVVDGKEQQAVAAAMELQRLTAGLREATGDDWPHIRCGLATGEVTAGYLGDDRHAAYTIIGRSVNLAARLEGSAQPGEILLDQATAQGVETSCLLEELQPRELRGIGSTILIWRVQPKE